MQDWPGLIEAYRAWLPVTDSTPVITLREGATPLIPVPSVAERIGKGVKVFVKYDGLNPTGSFKDRGMTMAISKAKEVGCEAVICASTGNTSAAAAAYARRGGMRAFVLIPDGYVAQGKLAQALVYGAEVLAIRRNFDRALASFGKQRKNIQSPSLTRSIPTACKGRRQLHLRSWMRLETHLTGFVFRWEMPAISRPTGWGFRNINRLDAADPCHE